MTMLVPSVFVIILCDSSAILQLTWVSSSLTDLVGKDNLEYGGWERAVTYLPLTVIAGMVQIQITSQQEDNVVGYYIIGR